MPNYATYHICSLLLISFTLTRAKDLQVDTNLTLAKGTTYPSLNEALNSLITGNNLTEPNNTITLLDSCLPVPQYFLGTTIGPAGTGGGSINIVYNGGNSIIDTKYACNQLPTLILANNSYIDLEYLTSFSISGVNIVFNHAPNLNSMYAIETVNFSNICFNNTEPNNTLSSTDYNYIEVIQSNTFMMTNGVYFFDEYKALTISEVNKVMIDSIAIIIEGSPIDGTVAAFEFSGEGNYTMSTEILNVSVSCGNLRSYGPPKLFWSSDLTSLEISSLDMSNCSFNYPILYQDPTISVTNVSSFVMANITINTVIFALNQTFCYISSVASTTLSNFNITGSEITYSSFSSLTKFIYITDEQPGSYYPMSVKFQQFSLKYCQGVDAIFFSISFSNYSNYGDILVQDFLLDFTGPLSSTNPLGFTTLVNSYFINCQIQSPNTNSLLTNITYFTIENMTIIKGSLSVSNLFYFSLGNPVMIKATEILRLNIKNFYFSPFIMLGGTVIQAEGILTHIIDSQITGGVFYAKSYFYLSQHTLNTLLMKNISFNGTVLLDNSALISTSTDVNKNSFKMVEDSFDDKNPSDLELNEKSF